jgi:prepilin-type N-terminal cleavage/methylation domain-containing protein
MQKHKGFTLIELLVVIAVIAILLGILVPTLNRAKGKAQTIVSRSNLKQYGIATSLYLDSNRNFFPYVNTWLFNNGQMGCQWHDSSRNLDKNPELAGVLWPYLKSKDIHLCSTFNSVARQTGCKRCSGKPNPVEPQYGYVMNPYLNGDIMNMVPKQYQAAVRQAGMELGVKNPAKVFLFSEEDNWMIDGLSRDSFNDNSLHAMPAPILDDCFATFHDPTTRDLDHGFANAVFVDGHADRVSAWPLGNTFILSWPGGSPIPTW